MTMNAHAHPDDELLAALAGDDPEASADRALQGHLAGCSRCSAVVSELSALRAALADLPDLAPVRPLELRLPAAQPSWGERLAALVQRGFAPVAGLAAALLLVGVIGTGAEMAGGIAAAPAAEPMPAAAPEHDAAEEVPRDHAVGDSEPGIARDSEDGESRLFGADDEVGVLQQVAGEGRDALLDGWPWNAFLALGTALLILALVLRLTLRGRATEPRN